MRSATPHHRLKKPPRHFDEQHGNGPRACSKPSHHVPCFAKAVAAKRKARNTEQKRACCPAQHLQHGRCCLCRARLRARQPMSRLLVASLATTGSLVCGVRCDPGQLLHLQIHGKTLNKLQPGSAHAILIMRSCLPECQSRNRKTYGARSTTKRGALERRFPFPFGLRSKIA